MEWLMVSTAMTMIVSVTLVSMVLLESAARRHVGADSYRFMGLLVANDTRAPVLFQDVEVPSKLSAVGGRKLGAFMENKAGIFANGQQFCSSSSDDRFASVVFENDDTLSNYTISCTSLTTPARTPSTTVHNGDVWGFLPSRWEQNPALWECKIQAPNSASCKVDFVAWARLSDHDDFTPVCNRCIYKIKPTGVFLDRNSPCNLPGITERVVSDRGNPWQLMRSFPMNSCSGTPVL